MNSFASSAFAETLKNELESLHASGLKRQLQLPSPTELSFAHNDYLGLARDPRLAASAMEVLSSWGTGAQAARLICGHSIWHARLEESLASLKQTQAALVFPSGYAAASGAIPALVKTGDYVVLDKLCHACLFDGAKLSGAHVKVFNHNDLGQAEQILAWIRGNTSASTRILLVAESLYSMDGDFAPLPGLVDLKNRFGAWLMIDEAHATGLFGPQGRGLISQHGLSGEIEIQMGTLSKAIGVHGGFIAGTRPLIDLLIHKARTFLFTTGTPPALAAAGTRAIEILQSPEGDDLRARLRARVAAYHSGIAEEGTAVVSEFSPIQLIQIGSESRALELSQQLKEAGFLIPSIRFPTVPQNQARLRVTLSAAHSEGEVLKLTQALRATGCLSPAPLSASV